MRVSTDHPLSGNYTQQSINSPFDAHPEFYQDDNRQHRLFNPVTKNFLEAKFGTLLPADLVANKRILDLGSCTGAAGQWVLFHGASQYTGVEVQYGYVEQSRRYLHHWGERARIVQQDVRSFLLACADQQFDLVLVAGMLYHFIDTKQVIDEICRVAAEAVVVETNYPPAMREGKVPLNLAITEYLMDQEVNLADQQASLLGVSATSSLAALDVFFQLNTFGRREAQLNFPITPDTVIYDQSLLGNSQLQLRFAVRYFRTQEQTRLHTLEENLPSQTGHKRSWTEDRFAQQKTAAYQQRAAELEAGLEGSWAFNAEIAAQFDQIAAREIADYQRVIDLCVHIVKRLNKPNPKVIDVGSAIGTTLQALYNAGITDLYGVDNSLDMLAKSFKRAKLILSDEFPVEKGPFDVVIANWVLHFIPDRAQYLADIRDSLSDDGVLILTEKVSSSEFAHELYYDIKRANGVSEADILRKRQQIKGVLTTREVNWYLNLLYELGFKHVDIINANSVFVTFMAQLEDHRV